MVWDHKYISIQPVPTPKAKAAAPKPAPTVRAATPAPAAIPADARQAIHLAMVLGIAAGVSGVAPAGLAPR